MLNRPRYYDDDDRSSRLESSRDQIFLLCCLRCDVIYLWADVRIDLYEEMSDMKIKIFILMWCDIPLC